MHIKNHNNFSPNENRKVYGQWVFLNDIKKSTKNVRLYTLVKFYSYKFYLWFIEE